MANATFICWHCHTAYRSEILAKDTVRRCAECGREIEWVSTKVEIPRKTDKKAWEALRDDLLSRRDKHIKAERSIRRRTINHYKEQIAKLESLPENEGRRKAIRTFEKKLAKLQDA